MNGPEGRRRFGSEEMLGKRNEHLSIRPCLPPSLHPSLYPAELRNARSHTHDGASDILDARRIQREKETEDTNWERSRSTHNISVVT